MDANNEQDITGGESIRAELKEMIDQSEPETPPTVQGPLTWRPFPVDVFPDPVREFIQQASESMQVDESFIALPMLVCAAAAIGNTRRVQMKPDWKEPPILWGAIIGRSDPKKRPALV